MTPPMKIKNLQPDSKNDVHLCWDCKKAGIPGTCNIYESLTNIIEENFDNVKILFSIPECEFFEEDSNS